MWELFFGGGFGKDKNTPFFFFVGGLCVARKSVIPVMSLF